MGANTLLLGTRKGLIMLRQQAGSWTVLGHEFAGVEAEYAAQDPRDGAVWLSLQHGHWGPKLHRKAPGQAFEALPAPAYPAGEKTSAGAEAVLENIWVVAPGGADQPGRMYLGTNPGGLFVSDQGESRLVRGLWDHPSRCKQAEGEGRPGVAGWFGGGRETPGVHSVVVDPRDSDHVYVGISCAGVFETRDGGESWAPRNRGLRADFLPDPTADVGQDPHFLAMCAAHPDVIWQQNHCGIWRTIDGGAQWSEISEPEGPARFGFAIAAHARRPDVAWVVPARSDGERNAIAGKLQVCRTEDGGASWQSCSVGLPETGAWDLVYRHALDIDGDALAFGSTTGNVFFSADGGEGWRCLGNHFPPIYSVRFAQMD